MDKDQVLKEIYDRQFAFTTWVNTYKVFAVLPEGEFKVEDHSDSTIWTEVYVGDVPEASFLYYGYQEASDDAKYPVSAYYLSELGPEDVGEVWQGLTTSLLFPCPACGDELQVDCEGCSGEGVFVEFDLSEELGNKSS